MKNYITFLIFAVIFTVYTVMYIQESSALKIEIYEQKLQLNTFSINFDRLKPINKINH